MKKSLSTDFSKVLAILVAAIVVLYQAVFLIGPLELVRAQFAPIVVTITNPAATTSVSGTVAVTVNVTMLTSGSLSTTDTVNLHWAGPDIGQAAMQPAGSANYKYAWNTTVLPDGVYKLTALLARDNMQYLSPSVSVTVANSPQPVNNPTANITPTNIISPTSTNSTPATVSPTTTTSTITSPTTVTANGATIASSTNGTTNVSTINTAATTTNNSIDNTAVNKSEETTTTLQSENTTQQTQTTTTEPSLNKTATVTNDYKVNFLDNPGFVNGPVKLSAQANFTPDYISFRVSGPKDNSFTATTAGDNRYYFYWNLSSSYPDGNYTVSVIATKDGQSASNAINVNFQHIVYAQPEPAATTTPSLTVTFGTLAAPLSGRQKIAVSLNQPADAVQFSVSGPVFKKFDGIKSDNQNFYFVWPTADYPDGHYTIAAGAFQDNAVAAYNSIVTDVKNAATTTQNNEIKTGQPSGAQTVNGPTPAQTETATKTNQPTTVATQPTPASNQVLPECLNEGIKDYDACKNYLALPAACRSNGITTAAACRSYLTLPADCRAENLSGTACQNFLNLPADCRQAGITDGAACRTYEQTMLLPQTCRDAGLSTQSACKQYLLERNMPPACQAAKITTTEDCNRLLAQTNEVTAACIAAGITSADRCAVFSAKTNLPQECRDAGVADQATCDYIMRNYYRLHFDKNGPEVASECAAAGITKADACANYLFTAHLPQKCTAAGITDAAGCKGYLFDYYGDLANITTSALPIECQQAGTTLVTDCQETLLEAYLPDACSSQGITSGSECEIYLTYKYLPPECLQQKIYDSQACNSLMLKLYGEKVCSQVGIQKLADCYDYLFNRYVPGVVCNNDNHWQCWQTIENRYLGEIAATRSQYQELKNQTAGIKNSTVKLADLAQKLSQSRELLPFTGENVNVKVVAADETIELDDNENLVKTAPVAIMVDSDGDGLPDDLERRIGTNPFRADTDGDGYSDGVEVRNGYNPLGSGRWTAKLAPIDEALVAGDTLGQPKTEGAVSPDLAVSRIINATSTASSTQSGYILAGRAKPNSVATLYIYSGLPAVMTVTTDQYGNWQYELSNSLSDGEHEVFVAVNDNTGKVVNKSQPFSFFIKAARAYSVDDYIATALPTNASRTESMIYLYMIMAGIIVVVGIVLFVIFFLIYKNKQEI